LLLASRNTLRLRDKTNLQRRRDFSSFESTNKAGASFMTQAKRGNRETMCGRVDREKYNDLQDRLSWAMQKRAEVWKKARAH
jgi:hypothetical protein